MRTMKILAIIPARGGSKRLPRKNILKLCGKPLIAYSILTALESKFINKIVVSTDDIEIAKIAQTYKNIEVIMRPKHLAKDDTPIIDVVFHVLDTLASKQGYVPDVIVLLQPTSPLRTVEDIDNSIRLFLTKQCDAVISVTEFPHSPYWAMYIDRDGYLKPLFGRDYLKLRSQDLPKVYLPNGAIYISSPNTLRKCGGFYCERIVPYIMPLERSVDIDTYVDFLLAEILLCKNKGF